ncbi:MAG: FtsX-like permease family protein [Acidobacteriia bacterium]|nr:FtsX-like permease family protein [Terriglobia bacterium]
MSDRRSKEMTGRQLFLRLLVRAAWVRKDRALTALISVAVVATIATAGLTVYYDLENKLSREFRNFGANVIVSKTSGTLSADELGKISAALGGKGEVVPLAYAIATAPDGSKVVVGGADLAKLTKLNSWWAIGEPHAGNALIGSRAAETLSRGSAFKVSFGKDKAEIRPQATFHSGSDDDSRIYVPLDDFVRWTGVQPSTALVRVDGRPRDIQDAIARLASALPQAEVKPVRQITQAQTAVIGKTRSLVLSASAAVVALIMLCMVATFTSSVLERRKDFAVMKALGASNRTVNFLFAAESSLLALAGAAAGYMLGSAVAFWIGRANFAAAIWPQPLLLAPVLLGSILLALAASTAPLRLLQQIQPAGILRGE